MAAKKLSKAKARVAEAREQLKKAKAPKPAKKAAAETATKAASPRTQPARGAGLKSALVRDLVTRPGGATLAEIMHETGWQKHSVRGFIAGALKKKLGLEVASTKDESGDRRYTVVEVAAAK